MKKTALAIILMTAVSAMAALSACTPSHIEVQDTRGAAEEESSTAEAKQETRESETEAATFPEGEVPTGVNGGPGLLPTTTADQSDLPEDKRSTVAEKSEAIIAVYCLDSTGVFQQMDVVEEVNEKTLFAGLISNGVLDPETELLSYKDNGDGSASIELSMLKGVYKKAKDEQLLACITDTYTENLGLTSVTIAAGGKEYGTFEFTNKYDRT